MVYWITRILGTKAAGEDLSPEEYGCIILDVRDLNDGKNETLPLVNTIKALNGLVRYAEGVGKRVVVQCQAGISRSNVLVATLLVLDGLEWDDALELVRKKCPRVQINQELLDQLRSIFK